MATQRYRFTEVRAHGMCFVSVAVQRCRELSKCGRRSCRPLLACFPLLQARRPLSLQVRSEPYAPPATAEGTRHGAVTQGLPV